uniref:DNA-directed RNA polymerase subunit omega n=1 Tax=Candidatus Limisoma sp. TaxID=3076476 RepID=UPI003FEE2E9A
MDYKRSNAPLNTVTRDVIKLSQDTGNVYETVCIIAKRANQIAVEMKKELEKILHEVATLNENLEDECGIRGLVEIAR